VGAELVVHVPHERPDRVHRYIKLAGYPRRGKAGLACGTWTRRKDSATEVDADLSTTTCRFCRAQLGLDDQTDTSRRLEALFVLSLTLGLRPGGPPGSTRA
jgi:hypothetical protein